MTGHKINYFTKIFNFNFISVTNYGNPKYNYTIIEVQIKKLKHPSSLEDSI